MAVLRSGCESPRKMLARQNKCATRSGENRGRQQHGNGRGGIDRSRAQRLNVKPRSVAYAEHHVAQDETAESRAERLSYSRRCRFQELFVADSR
jgi:hypothetical protein